MPKLITEDDIKRVWDTYEAIHGVPTITNEERLKGARKLYRTATGVAWKGKTRLTFGRSYVNDGQSTLFVKVGSPWRQVCNDLASDLTSTTQLEMRRQHRINVEYLLAKRVCQSDWLLGVLKPKPKAPPTKEEKRAAKIAALEARREQWVKKRDRATNAIKKIDRSLNATRRFA